MKQTRNKHRKSGFYRSLKSTFRLLFVPHVHNSFRPHITRSWVLVSLMLAFVSGQFITSLVQTSDTYASSSDLAPYNLLAEANQFRSEAGVRPLRLDTQLSAAAQAKAQDMFAGQYWNHVSPSGVQPWHWMAAQGYEYFTAGENLAKNFFTAATVTQAWYDSPLHRENMLNANFTEVGFASMRGSLNGAPVTITVAMYAQPTYAGSVLATVPLANVPSPETFVSAGVDTRLSITQQMQLAYMTMPPYIIGGVYICLALLLVLAVAHRHRHKIPESIKRRNGFAVHHAAIKGLGMSLFLVGVFWVYSTGQV